MLYSGFVAGAGKDIGQHAAVDEAREGQQDVACPVPCRPVASVSPGSADHRVAPPVAEPGIAGDHRSCRSARPDSGRAKTKAVGGKQQLRDPVGRVGHFGHLRAWSRSDSAAVACRRCQRGRRDRATDPLPGCRQCRPICRDATRASPRRPAMVVSVGQAALALDRQIEIFEPLPRRGDDAAAGAESQRESGRLHTQASFIGIDHRDQTRRPPSGRGGRAR